MLKLVSYVNQKLKSETNNKERFNIFREFVSDYYKQLQNIIFKYRGIEEKTKFEIIGDYEEIDTNFYKKSFTS
jgi:hypothetical protein